MESTTLNPKGKQNNRLLVFAVLAVSAINAFWMLSANSLQSHECFVSVVAREMVQKNDYLWPTLNGQPRLQKTPLSYWLVAGLSKITGKVDELTTRLPSAIFALLSAIVLLYYVNKFSTLRIAALSTAVWSTSLAYIREAQLGRPDMVMTFFIIVCMLSFYRIVTSEEHKTHIVQAIIFWASLALGNLAKGPAPIPYVLVPVFVYLAVKRDWKSLKRLFYIPGVLVFLAILLPWPLFIAQRLNWDLILWKKEFFDRFFGEYARGNYPIYYYFGMMFKFTFPWVIFLPLALAAPFARVWGSKRPFMIYLWIWFVANFLWLTIDQGKRQHYILPLIPAMMVLIGIMLDDMFFSRQAHTISFIKNILKVHIAVAILAALTGAIIIAFIKPALLGRVILLSIVILAAAFIFILSIKKDMLALACGSVFAAITIFVIVFSAFFYKVVDVNIASRDFALTVAKFVPASDTLISYKHTSSRFIHYYGKIVPEVTDIPELKKDYENGDWIVCLEESMKDLENLNLKIVYFKEQDPKLKTDSGGVLFHKTAEPEKTGNSPDK